MNEERMLRLCSALGELERLNLPSDKGVGSVRTRVDAQGTAISSGQPRQIGLEHSQCCGIAAQSGNGP